MEHLRKPSREVILALLVGLSVACGKKDSSPNGSANDVSAPTSVAISTETVTPPPPDDPETAERKKNLTGQLYHHGDNFAVYNWDASQLSFFTVSTGTLLSKQESSGPTEVFDRSGYVSARVYSLCPLESISKSSECTKPVYPEPTKIVKSEILQVLSKRGITNDSQLLLASTERYRAQRNTAFNPVAKPFHVIYDLAGNEVFTLPAIEHSSGTHIFAMGIDPDGPAALFGIGGTMDVCNGDNDYDMPALVTHVFIWTPPGKLTRVDTRTRTAEVDALIKRFGLIEHWFYFYPWPSKEARHGC